MTELLSLVLAKVNKVKIFSGCCYVMKLTQPCSLALLFSLIGQNKVKICQNFSNEKIHFLLRDLLRALEKQTHSSQELFLVFQKLIIFFIEPETSQIEELTLPC